MSKPLLVILAGGQSRRMGGVDKAEVRLGGQRLLDHVIGRFQPQVSEVILSARGAYGTGLAVVPDAPNAPGGPAGGLWSVRQWLATERPEVEAFCTVPVDTPWLPGDLLERLQEAGGCAYAETVSGPHPTCARWSISTLRSTFSSLPAGNTLSLRALARACDARAVTFEDETAFANINTPEDLARADTEVDPR